MGERISDKNIEINKDKVKAFFSDRALRANEMHSLAPVIYQDENYELASKRDVYEKKTLLPKVVSRKNEKVIDIGCGIGRWADNIFDKVEFYYGTDLTFEFVDIANKKFEGIGNVSFEALDALASVRNMRSDYFSSLIVAGLFIYLDDYEIRELLKEVSRKMAIDSTVVIREPLCVTGTLVLDDIWSDELKSYYSAKYRNVDVFSALLDEILLKEGFFLDVKDKLYPDELNNRGETSQFYFVYKRGEY